jgi:hypothetical protein
MKPKPLASLNHFTVPVMRAIELILSPQGNRKASAVGERRYFDLSHRRIVMEVMHYP